MCISIQIYIYTYIYVSTYKHVLYICIIYTYIQKVNNPCLKERKTFKGRCNTLRNLSLNILFMKRSNNLEYVHLCCYQEQKSR